MKIGDQFRLTEDALENYGNKYDGVYTVSYVSRNRRDHPGYDEGMKGRALYDAEELSFSLYDWEVEEV